MIKKLGRNSYGTLWETPILIYIYITFCQLSCSWFFLFSQDWAMPLLWPTVVVDQHLTWFISKCNHFFINWHVICLFYSNFYSYVKIITKINKELWNKKIWLIRLELSHFCDSQVWVICSWSNFPQNIITCSYSKVTSFY